MTVMVIHWIIRSDSDTIIKFFITVIPLSFMNCQVCIPSQLSLKMMFGLVFGVTILRGVRIGKGSVISAGATVVKDVPLFIYLNKVVPTIIPIPKHD